MLILSQAAFFSHLTFPAPPVLLCGFLVILFIFLQQTQHNKPSLVHPAVYVNTSFTSPTVHYLLLKLDVFLTFSHLVLWPWFGTSDFNN